MTPAANPLDRDTRPRCVDCAKCVARHCTDAIAAGISHKQRRLELGSWFASTRQNCPAFVRRTQ